MVHAIRLTSLVAQGNYICEVYFAHVLFDMLGILTAHTHTCIPYDSLGVRVDVLRFSSSAVSVVRMAVLLMALTLA